MKQRNDKRKGLAIGLVLCLALVGVGGVMAWYSSQSSITNTFTTGNIKPPTTDPTIPQKPINPDVAPDPEHNGHKGQVSGNIVENNWVPGSVITAGSEIPKNPNIGIAPGSDDAYVFVYVNNKLGTGTSFKIDSAKWKAVDGLATAGTGVDEFTGGLFMYTTDGTNPALLDAQEAGGKDAWTGELFQTVHASADAQVTGTEMTVSCYMVAKSNATEQFSAQDALNAAKEWAVSQKK